MTGALRRRAPLVVFGAAQVVAFALWMNVGKSDWFYIDEWDFIANRKAGDLGDVFRSHNGHWTTLPVLAFRGLYALVGLRTYVPYRILAIAVYLVVAALLLAVMRRAGAHPWIATSAAIFFVFFGAGWENIILPFQITFTGSLAFGLVYVLLADHDGPFDRRDWLGLVAGLLGLMCSGVGIVMVAAVGIVVFLRRGWEQSLRHVVPLASCYAVWLIAIGHTGSNVSHVTPAEVLHFTGIGWQASFGAIGPFGAFGVVLVAVLGVGLVLTSGQRPRSRWRLELAAPAALLAGALLVLLLTGIDRGSVGADWARQPRYISLVGTMALPALAVAADAIARRWRQTLPFAIALFLVGIPANVRAATNAQPFLKARDAATRSTILSLPRVPLARRVPGSVRPEPNTATEVTMGWLLGAAADHKLADPGVITPHLLASDNFRLSFVRPNGTNPTTNCRSLRRPTVIDVRKGGAIGVSEGEIYVAPAGSRLVSVDMLFPAARDAPIVALRDAGPVRFRRVDRRGSARICVGTP